MPTVSVIPLGRVCGRGPSELLLFDRLSIPGAIVETGLVMAVLGAGMSFMDIFRVRAFSTSDCVL